MSHAPRHPRLRKKKKKSPKSWTVTYRLSARPGILRSQPLPFDLSCSRAWRSTAPPCPSPGGTSSVPEWSPWSDLGDSACPSDLRSQFSLCSTLPRASRAPAPAAQETSVLSLQSDPKGARADQGAGSAALGRLPCRWKRKPGAARRRGDSRGWSRRRDGREARTPLRRLHAGDRAAGGAPRSAPAPAPFTGLPRLGRLGGTTAPRPAGRSRSPLARG